MGNERIPTFVVIKSGMKTPFQFCAILLLLVVGLSLSCRPKPEPVKPVVTPPPSSTTASPPSITVVEPPISSTAPLPPEGCLVTRIIYKAVVRVAPVVSEEMVSADGTTYTVALKSDTRYVYNAQKRLTNEIIRYPTGSIDSVDYRYEVSRIYIRKRAFGPGLKTISYTQLDTIRLNAQGWAENKDSYYKRAEYNAQGYLFRFYTQTGRVALENFMEKGNLKERYNYYTGEEGNLFEYMTYDTTRPDIPHPLPIYGKPNRNLLLVTRLQAQKSYIYPNDRDIYRLDHFYGYDQRGLVRQLIRRATSTGFDLSWDSGGVGVFTYEYACP